MGHTPTVEIPWNSFIPIVEDMLATRPKRRDGCVLYLPRPMREKLAIIRTKDRSDAVISVKIQFTNETPMVDCKS